MRVHCPDFSVFRGKVTSFVLFISAILSVWLHLVTIINWDSGAGMLIDKDGIFQWEYNGTMKNAVLLNS